MLSSCNNFNMSGLSLVEHKLFVGNMPGDVTAEEIEAAFSQFGSIVEVYIMGGNRSKSGQSSAFVKFQTFEACEYAIAEMHMKGKIRATDSALLAVKFAKPQAARPEGSPNMYSANPGAGLDTSSTTATSSPNTTPLPSPFNRSSPGLAACGLSKVFVGGMPSYVDRDDLIAIFSPFGKVESVHLMNKNKSKSGQSCAFVNFHGREASLAAIEALNAKYTIEEGMASITVRFADSGEVQSAPKRQKTQPHEPHASLSLTSIEKLAEIAAMTILEQSVSAA